MILGCAGVRDGGIAEYQEHTIINTDTQWGDFDLLGEQEWSSMESSSYENRDEIEMLFGHLVCRNLQ